MKVTDGALTAEFRELRLPLGTGLLGLVAQSGQPYYTEDYQSDERFLHRDYIDEAVDGEQIRAILGVPLTVGGKVIGALLAVHRTVRAFPPGEVALLTSFAAHAAVALENARLFEQAREAVTAADRANAELLARNEATERAAHAHDRLTDALVHGGGIAEVAGVLAEALRGRLRVYDDERRALVGDVGWPADAPSLEAAETEARASGRCVPCKLPDGPAWVAVAAAGEEHLATLVLCTDQQMDRPERRTLERGALVVALVLLFGRRAAEAENQVRGELLADLLAGPTSGPGPAQDAEVEHLRERARQQRADLDGDVAVAVAQPAEQVTGRQLRAVTALAGELAGLGGEYDGRLVLAAAGEPQSVARRLHDRLDGATVGVAATTEGIRGFPAAHRDARQTLEALLRLGRAGEVSDPAGLGLARILLGSNDGAALDEFIDRTLGPVVRYDSQRRTALVETLHAWSATGGALRETATRLHLHPNTVSQRLDRVDRLLGPQWRDPDRRLDVQLALQLLRLRRDM